MLRRFWEYFFARGDNRTTPNTKTFWGNDYLTSALHISGIHLEHIIALFVRFLLWLEQWNSPPFSTQCMHMYILGGASKYPYYSKLPSVCLVNPEERIFSQGFSRGPSFTPYIYKCINIYLVPLRPYKNVGYEIRTRFLTLFGPKTRFFPKNPVFYYRL